MRAVLKSLVIVGGTLLTCGVQAQVRYTLSADEQEVSDSRTGLVWRRCVEGMTAGGGTCTGSPSLGGYTHEAALKRAALQAANDGRAWRLPNVKELSSLVDRTQANPAIDSTAFPATPSKVFWTSTPLSVSSEFAWYVYFDRGEAQVTSRTESYLVRLVRDAP